ncbi:MAG TPA: biopolymer transporter ExbD [Verrucomicrobia bacterium]|nr:biopolymer transporter ExbD [Verrucomicrobiota bacterium]
MKLRRPKYLVETPTSAMNDIAFILIVFFLVCASVEPEDGRSQVIPRSEKNEEQQASQSTEVGLTPATVTIDGTPYRLNEFQSRIRQILAQKKTEAERVVVLKSQADVPYEHWIAMTGIIERAGGIVTLLLEEEQTVIIN